MTQSAGLSATDISFDVSKVSKVSKAVGDGEQLTQTAWLFVPEGSQAPRAALICLAGGTYDKHYWHLEIPGHPGYSFAQHMARQGFVVVALDHLGVGGSTTPKESGPIGLEMLARGDASVAAQVQTKLKHGTLSDLIPPTELPLIGVGHSMGSCLTTMAQALTAPYDAVVLLGYGVQISNVQSAVSGDNLEEAVNQNYEILRGLAGAEPGALEWVIPRDPLRELFYASDVPDAVIARDKAVASRLPARANAEVITAGFVERYAAEIKVPIFLGLGAALDVSPDPYAELTNYRASNDVTLFLLEDSAHCHNFAGKRTLLWDRVAAWIPTVTHQELV